MPTFVETASEEETRALGNCLGRLLEAGDLVGLEGDLGAGKTVLVQGIARGLGVSGDVHSPTFVLHHHHPGPVPLEHYDLYRLEGTSWEDTGIDEPAPESVTVVEWSERAAVLGRWATVRLRLEVVADGRRRVTLLSGRPALRRCFHE
jgi:tRNA threonylcarbamoyladenosine biosynthesis protein TsaE